MFKNRKLEVKVVKDKKNVEQPLFPQTRPTAQEVEAAKDVLVGAGVLFLAKLVADAATEISVAYIKSK